jgi:hypothetical protein
LFRTRANLKFFAKFGLPFGTEPNERTRRTLEMADRGEDVHHAADMDDLARKLRS